ncbi:MAG: hypothetical protein HY929_07150 [Euryarchaeota archaeon]|nr:hypothetical protein [Euryarchaeota archaeon]
MKVEKATSNEIERIKKTIDQDFEEQGLFDKAFKDMEFVAVRGRWTEIFIFPKENSEFLVNVLKRYLPYSLGICIGEFHDKFFRIGLEGIYEISKYTTKKKVWIIPKAEQLVLYGRDVFGSSVSRVCSYIKKNDRVIVVNEFDDPIAIGKALVPSDEIKEAGNKVVIENLLDRGWYLRKGR